MQHEHDSCEQTPGWRHLARLRDHLDLPLNALADNSLAFTLPEGHGALAVCTGDGRLTLVCEVAALDALADSDWRMLATRLSDAYDPDFPVSLGAMERRLALIWSGRTGAEIDAWLRKAEDALTFSLEMQAVLSGRQLVDCVQDGAGE